MGARLFVGIAGAAVILLAALGLAVDVERGGVRDHALQATVYDAVVDMDLEVRPGTTGPGGECLITQCTPTTSTLTLTALGLPDLSAAGAAYVVDVGEDRALGPLRQEGPWRITADLGRDISGEPLVIRLSDGAWSRVVFADVARSAENQAAAFQLVDGDATLATEQIGAVEVSALIDATVDAPPPAGWAYQASIDGRAIGVVEGGVLDVRIERLDLGAAERFTLSLVRSEAIAADPLAPATGIVVFAATL